MKVARHPLRPHPSEIIKNVFTNWQPLAGDRGFKEDNALLGGIAKLGDVPCVVIGIEKGKQLIREFSIILEWLDQKGTEKLKD